MHVIHKMISEWEYITENMSAESTLTKDNMIVVRARPGDSQRESSTMYLTSQWGRLAIMELLKHVDCADSRMIQEVDCLLKTMRIWGNMQREQLLCIKREQTNESRIRMVDTCLRHIHLLDDEAHHAHEKGDDRINVNPDATCFFQLPTFRVQQAIAHVHPEFDCVITGMPCWGIVELMRLFWLLTNCLLYTSDAADE